MKKITSLITICLFFCIAAKSQNDSLIIWSLATDTNPTYISPQLKAKGERFGNKITNVTYANGYQKIAAPVGGWTNTIDTTTTAGVYLDFPFGLSAVFSLGNNLGYGCAYFFPNDFQLSAYTDAANDSIKITPYFYDSSLYVDSSIFFFGDTTKVQYQNYSCGGSPFSNAYYKYNNGHWYYFHINLSNGNYDSSIVLNYYQALYPTTTALKKGNEFYISSNSASNPTNNFNSINYTYGNFNNERLLFLRLYISSTNPNANLYLKNVALGGYFVTLLPISFNSFTATKNSNNIQLHWQMKDETNIDKYIVEKAVVQDEFKPMTTVVSVNKSNYNIVDEAPNKGDNFYRIKAISKDGKITYSSIVKVVFGVKEISIKINPNPVKNILYASVENKKDENVIVQITDMQGKVLQQKKVQLQVGYNNFYVSTIGLKAGTYSLIVSGSNKQTIQFIKD